MVTELANDPPFTGLARQMARMMDQLQRGFFEYSPARTWTPAVNLYEGDDTYHVCVDLAGVDKEKIDLSVGEGVLRFRGQRATPAPVAGGCERCRVHLMEIDYGTFARELALPPDADAAGITAQYENGLLWIRIPKRPAFDPSTR
jgi:HSP20 family protein